MICDVCTGKGHCRGGNTRVSSKIRLLSASWGTEICQFTMSGNQEFAGIKVDDPFETNQWMEGLMEVRIDGSGFMHGWNLQLEGIFMYIMSYSHNALRPFATARPSHQSSV